MLTGTPRPNVRPLVTFDPAGTGCRGTQDEPMEVDHDGLEVLTRAECMRLLGTAVVGRLALTTGALPTVLAVNFTVHGDDIIFRTGRDTKLDAATRDAVVAFEADDIDAATRTGWSVVVTGVAREVTDPGLLDQDWVRDLPRWVPQGDSRVVAVSTDLVSGRRVAPRVHASMDGRS